MERKHLRITEILKRVICLVVVFVMLTGNVISPVKSIAEEINNDANTTVTEENTNEENAEGTEEGENTTSEEDTQARIDEIEAAFEANQEREQANNSNVNESAEENQEPVEQPAMPAQIRGLRSSAPALRGANTQAASDKIEDRITPDKKDEVTVKTKNDAYEINTFNTEFVSGATKDENGNLVWTPDSTASGHEFRFRINYALSGLGEHPAEAIKITIPKQILRNRNGAFADIYEMSLPTYKEYDGTTEFAFIENGNYIVIYNPDEVKAAINGYIEVAYKTNTSTTNYRDYDKANTDLVTNGGTASDPFNAVITVKTTVRDTEDTLANVSDDKNLFINTIAKIQSTQKYQPTIYREWNNSWTAEVPEDKDDYYYLIWTVVTNIQSGTQPYTFSLQDTVTNLTEGTNAEDYQFVGYKLSGETYFSDKSTDNRQCTGTQRTDYVLTRHKKSTFTGINYKLKNTVTATVNPIDQVDPSTNATSSNVFNWSSEFKIPTGHFELFKRGNNNWNGRYWDYANYELDKLQSGEVDELKGFKYSTDVVGYAYPWTLKEGGSSDNAADYGYNPVNYDTWDDTLYLENDENPMNYEDYYLEYFTYGVTNSDVEYDDFYNKFNTKPAVYADDEILTFYGKFADGQDWIQIGTINLKTQEITFNDTYVESMTTSKVTFKEGVHATGWRHTTSNKHYYTGISVTPYYVLTNSDYVMEKIADKDKIQIKNIVKTKITDYKNETIFEAERAAIDYARVTYYDSYIEKTVVAGSNNVAKKKYNITWKVKAYETATSGTGDKEYIRQDSGRFYDLIPSGGEIDLKSIQVQTEAGFLAENEYAYETIPDYNNSGRTLLIINIDVQAQHFTVSYKTVHSWESMQDFGRNVLNPVAYETGNEKITKGFPDNGGNLSEDNKVLFTNLDNTTDANKFIYAEKPHNINALTATVSGLHKKVKSEKDTDYKYDARVESNGRYSYQLRYQNTFMNKSKNLVLFDSLENFEIVDSDAGTTKTSGWKGTLQSIDVSQLRQKGIDPVIYISTVENLDIEAHNDLTDTSIWTKVTFLTDLSEAKAIAIDARKYTNGNDYLLEPGDAISVTLNMKAPAEISEQAEEKPYAYNNVYLKGTLLDVEEEVSDFLIHQDYTTIKYYIMADIPLVKVNEENTDEKIKGITFRLWGTSNYGTDVDVLVTSDRNGRITFKDIELGEYKLQEYETNDDWFMDYTEHQVRITRNREVYIDNQLVANDVPFEVTNKPRIHADVSFNKRNIVTKSSMEGVKFKLSGTSDYGNEVLMYKYSDREGIVKFEDLEKGVYDLTEAATIDGYILNKTKYRVIVDDNGNYDIQKQILEQVTKSETVETIEYEDIVKYSHTDNIDDSGYASSNYNNNLRRTDTVTIPGAEQLEVTVYYSTQDLNDWVAVYGKDVTPSFNNFTASISGKRGGNGKSYSTVNSSGYQSECGKYTTTVPGDTVKFYFYSNASTAYYGYYAIITAKVSVTQYDNVEYMETVGRYESIYNNGSYNIYNEPYHSFYYTKKDSYNFDKLGGAKFRLFGCSNNGNIYDQTVTSVEGTGYVTFENLESGTYVLKEMTPPNTNETTYIVDNTEHIVEVYEDGKVTLDSKTIWPLSETNNEEYTWYNKRNKGQITITKKWIDNLTNDDRQEPTIYISTKKPTKSYSKAYFRTATSISIIDYVSMTEDVIEFRRNTTLSETEVLAKPGVKRIDNDSENNNVKYKIYGWVENGTLYWWTKADCGVLPANLNNYFYNESTLKDIDWSGIYTSGYWTGTQGSEQMVESITEMKNIFYNCSSIESLNIAWFNNTAITTAANMQYAFGNNSSSTPTGKMEALKYITIGENFKLFNTSLLTGGGWRNQETEEQYTYTNLVGNIVPGTYEYTGILFKYAVQIYGIQQDKDENGNTLGLTFGPATAQNSVNSSTATVGDYNDAYATHTYESNGDGTYKVVIVRHNINTDGTETIETKYLKNSNGDIVTRTEAEKIKYDVNIHELTWEQISNKSQADPTVFTDCMLCGDTKSVQINLNNTIARGLIPTFMGDGAGVLERSLDEYYTKWNPSSSDNAAAINGGTSGSNAKEAGGYASSHIRATLIGVNDKTDVTYAGDVNLTNKTCLYSCIEDDLKLVIANKSVKYLTGSSESSATVSTVYDPIWLFSSAEMCVKGIGAESLEGTAENLPMAYQKFNNTDSVSFISETYSNPSKQTTARMTYRDLSMRGYWWLRTPSFTYSNEVAYMVGDGYGQTASPKNIVSTSAARGIAFGFCIK